MDWIMDIVIIQSHRGETKLPTLISQCCNLALHLALESKGLLKALKSKGLLNQDPGLGDLLGELDPSVRACDEGVDVTPSFTHLSSVFHDRVVRSGS